MPTTNHTQQQQQQPGSIPAFKRGKRDASADHDPNETVEQRLLRKGKEYKSKKAQKLHEQMQEEAVFGPQYRPQLVANNDAYLVNGQNPLMANMSAHEMLY